MYVLDKKQANTAVDQSNSAAMLSPDQGELPSSYADRIGRWYVSGQSTVRRRAQGIYHTPIKIARFMAAQLAFATPNVRILDPAAGCGVLSCAAIESLVEHHSAKSNPLSIELVAYENDEGVIAFLQAVLMYLKQWCNCSTNVCLNIKIKEADYIVSNAENLGWGCDFFNPSRPITDFDAVICNPPYFKIGKADPRAAIVEHIVHGQPNIYALFMATAAVMLKNQGSFVFIVPRSFASGPYFRKFREVFFSMIKPLGVHLFIARDRVFRRDDVLQENVIFSGQRQESWHKTFSSHTLALSFSNSSDDIDKSTSRVVPMHSALNFASADKTLKLPMSAVEDKLLTWIDSWPNNLKSLGLQISTGPVVAFRANKFIDGNGRMSAGHVPLLWMNHVKAMRIDWPLYGRKPEFIKRNSTKSLLVPSKNYVLLRRFSSKEQHRRLIAAPYMATRFAFSELGIENHLNYVYRPGGELNEDEAWGLAALYNSPALDTYFRISNGNTQVSATEIRAMPLPALEQITSLGRAVMQLSNPMQHIDQWAAEFFLNTRVQEAIHG